MRKIIYIAGVIFALAGCRKDAEQPALEYLFSVKENNTFGQMAVNETATFSLDLETEYDFEKIGMSYKVLSDKVGTFSLNGQELKQNESIALTEKKLTLSYTGKEEGKHKIQILFSNEKGANFMQSFEIDFAKFGFSLEILGGENEVYQGQNAEYKLVILPEKDITDKYQILFKSFDEQDLTLEKSTILLQNQKIEFEKWYDISDLTNTALILNSFHFGSKKLVYEIKNTSETRTFTIGKEFKKRSIEVKSLTFSKLLTDNINETLNIKGFVKKTTLNTKIWYKTWISDGTRNLDGIENTQNKYQEFSLSDNEEFSINVNTSKTGVYVYKVQFKDEFGNESPVTDFTITVKDKTYIINQTNGDFSNIHQGQTAQILFKIEEADTTNETYKISFIEFDNQDIFLNKSSILFNGNTVGLNTEIEITDLFNNKIEVNSFHQGDKKLVYKIWNSVGKEIIKETIINFKKAPISSEIEIRSSYVQGETFTLTGKVNTLSREGKIKYKTWAEIQKIRIKRKFFFDYETYFEETQDIPTTNSDWLVYDLDNNKRFELTQNLQNIGTYRYYIQFQDEFGNESQPQMLSFSVDPPIVIDELKLELGSTSDFSFDWRLILKARNINDTAVLTHADVYLPNTEQIFTVSYKGKVHALTINSYKNHDDFGLDNKRDVDINKYCDWDVRVKYQWNINVSYTDDINSVKILLREKFQNEYKPRVTIWNSKGHNISVEVPFSNLNF